jgi:predicted O-methyltransferase YrrM
VPIRTETGLYDVSADAHQVDLASLEVLNWAPALLTSSERLMLYSLIYSLRPARYLEIGTMKGGSALITSAAMDASNSEGRIVCVDVKPQVDSKDWQKIEHRASMIVGSSREVLPRARDVAGGPFDFVFIDADHREPSVFQDANQVMPILAEDGYLLFHDSYYRGVARATRKFALQHLGRVVDFGNLTREFCTDSPEAHDRYCGFRLIQMKSPSDGMLSRTWNHWRLALGFALRQRLPVPAFVRKARRALQSH